MAYLLHGFLWFIRRGPLALLFVACLVLGLAVYLQVIENDLNTTNAAAFEAGPPAAVDIQKFDRDLHQTERREAVVRGQAVMEDAYRLTLERNGPDDFAYLVPLVSTTATDDRVIYGAAVFSSRSFDFDDLTPELTLSGVVGFGAVGPIIEYNGKLSDLGKWEELAEEAFAIEGMTMAAGATIVWPYLEGREAAFAPNTLSMFDIFSKIAAAIALLGLVKLVFGMTSDDAATAGPPAVPVTHAPAPTEAQDFRFDVAQAEVAPTKPAVPLWKQRAGLVDPEDVLAPEPEWAPELAEPTAAPLRFEQPAPVAPDLAAAKARTGFGLRKVLIGVVGVAFFVLLGSTIYGLMADGTGPASGADVAVTSSEDLLAATVADLVVPDADPNRHWTDIDVTPVFEWFVAKAVLAATGDSDAMILLASIVGGVIFAMFMLRFYFITRSALRPRTTARIDSMGIN